MIVVDSVVIHVLVVVFLVNVGVPDALPAALLPRVGRGEREQPPLPQQQVVLVVILQDIINSRQICRNKDLENILGYILRISSKYFF
jgi:hypothetical protein